MGRQRIPPRRAGTTAGSRGGSPTAANRPGALPRRTEGGPAPREAVRASNGPRWAADLRGDPALQRLPRFFLQDPEAPYPELLAEERRHALSVLRLQPGDRLIGLDGVGGLHPLMVRSMTRRELSLEREAPPWREPEPGSQGSPLPRLEVAAALPKGERAESMLDRLTQLGLCAFRPLACARNQGFPRESAEARLEGLLRACREACKQSGRSWLPRIHPTARPGDLRALLVGSSAALLAPDARRTLQQWCATLGVTGTGPGEFTPPPVGPVVVIAGPEGGFDDAEQASLEFATPAVLGPHILRIETAVEAAVAILAGEFYGRASAAARPAPRGTADGVDGPACPGRAEPGS